MVVWAIHHSECSCLTVFYVDNNSSQSRYVLDRIHYPADQDYQTSVMGCNKLVQFKTSKPCTQNVCPKLCNCDDRLQVCSVCILTIDTRRFTHSKPYLLNLQTPKSQLFGKLLLVPKLCTFKTMMVLNYFCYSYMSVPINYCTAYYSYILNMSLFPGLQKTTTKEGVIGSSDVHEHWSGRSNEFLKVSCRFEINFGQHILTQLRLKLKQNLN